MSYCRLGTDSDVYIYSTIVVTPEPHRGIVCCLCSLHEVEGEYYVTATNKPAREMHIHLLKHVDAGHKVPQRAFDRLEKEMLSE